MADPDNLVLEHLRAIRAATDELRADSREIKGRLTALEQGQAAIRRDLGVSSETDARIQGQLDRLGDRVERIERRLGLTDA